MDSDISLRMGREESTNLIGSGIAQVLAHQGRQVVMKDRDSDAVARGMRSASKVFDGRVKRRKMTPVEKKTAMPRIHGTTADEPFERSDFVIEAVFEDVDVKHQVIREMERVRPERMTFASKRPRGLLPRAARSASVTGPGPHRDGTSLPLAHGRRKDHR